jgi:hypothetical protein
MDIVTGAVAIVGLQAAAKPGAELIKSLLERMLGPVADAAGGMMAHPLKEFHRKRVERAEQILLEAATLLAESGREAQQVPGRVLWPVLELGSLEDENELRQRWAALLASAATDPAAVPPAFPKLLSELSPLDVRILAARAQTEPVHYMRDEDGTPMRLDFSVPDGLHMQDVLIALTNLERLRLIELNGTIDDLDTEKDLSTRLLRLTTFGRVFFRACSAPPRPEPPRRRPPKKRY